MFGRWKSSRESKHYADGADNPVIPIVVGFIVPPVGSCIVARLRRPRLLLIQIGQRACFAVFSLARANVWVAT